MLIVAVARSFSDDNTVRHIYFRFCGWRHVFTMGQWSRIKHYVMFSSSSLGDGSSQASETLCNRNVFSSHQNARWDM